MCGTTGLLPGAWEYKGRGVLWAEPGQQPSTHTAVCSPPSLWLNEFCPQRNEGIKTSNSSGPALFVTSLFSNAQNPQGRWCWQEAASSETARLDLFLLSLMQHIALYGAFEFIYNTVLKNKRPLGNRCNCKGNC